MTTSTLLPSHEAVAYLIAAGGNSKLAAVNATRDRQSQSQNPSSPDSPPVTEAQLLAAITNDPNSLGPLTQQLNLLLILNTVESLRLSHYAFIQSLPTLSAKDVSLTYIKLLQTLTNIARPDQTSGGQSPQGAVTAPQLTPAQIFDALPPKVSDAIRLLMDNPNDNFNPNSNS